MLTNKEKKANDILKILEKLYPKTPIPLSHKDPYTLLEQSYYQLNVLMKE